MLEEIDALSGDIKTAGSFVISSDSVLANFVPSSGTAEFNMAEGEMELGLLIA